MLEAVKALASEGLQASGNLAILGDLSSRMGEALRDTIPEGRFNDVSLRLWRQLFSHMYPARKRFYSECDEDALAKEAGEMCAYLSRPAVGASAAFVAQKCQRVSLALIEVFPKYERMTKAARPRLAASA